MLIWETNIWIRLFVTCVLYAHCVISIDLLYFGFSYNFKTLQFSLCKCLYYDILCLCQNEYSFHKVIAQSYSANLSELSTTYIHLLYIAESNSIRIPYSYIYGTQRRLCNNAYLPLISYMCVYVYFDMHLRTHLSKAFFNRFKVI